MKKFKGLNVTILVEDVENAKTLAQALRKIEILPSIFTDLDDFDANIAKKTYDLAIVDVLKMTKGNKSIKELGLIESGKLPVAFFYDANSSLLSSSTYAVPNCGLINLDSFQIEEQILEIVEKGLNNKKLEVINNKLKKEIISKEIGLGKMIKTQRSIEVKEDYYNKFKTIISTLKLKLKNLEFYDACFDVFENWEDVESFSFYELTPSGHKLVSPNSHLKKYVSLPSVWLGQKQTDSIQGYGQSLGYHVAVDYMGDNIVPILLKGLDIEQPQAIFYIQTDEGLIENFDWALFQEVLTAHYLRHVLLTKRYKIHEGHMLSSWEFMSGLELSLQKALPSSKQVLVIDFNKLVTCISEKGLPFYWKNFIDQISAGLRSLINDDFSMACMGTRHLIVHLDNKVIDQYSKNIKEYLNGFSYWRFFEDPDTILSMDLAPKLHYLGETPGLLLKYLDKSLKLDYHSRPNRTKPREISEI